MENFAREVYESLIGERIKPVEGVEDAFTEGGVCETYYAQMRAAYDRLLVRLDESEEDPDIECIIDAFFHIQRDLCLKMYAYGARFGER